MIAALLLLQAAAAPAPAVPQPREDPVIKCAFDHARQLAAGSSEAPAVIAEKVVGACAPAENAAGPDAGFTRSRVRAAATAMVERLRGLDGQPADAPFQIPVMEGRLEIPDEIAPAVVPYLICLHARAGTPIYNRGNREAVIPPPPGITKGSDCSGMRKEAAEKADGLLRAAGHRDAAERQAFIERTLEQADNFLPAAKPPAQPQN